MGQILKTRYDANEMAKNVDFIHGETREIENLSTLLEYLLKPSAKDVIVSGGTVRERSAPSMNVNIDPILAFIRSSGKFVHAGSTLGPVSIVDGGAQARIDTLEVRYKETTYDAQQRAYKDPVTGNISYQDFDTKARYEMEAQVIQGTEGAGVAPNHTAEWIKLAEISVDAGETTSILDADIENCTGGYDGEGTANWTAETNATFRLESLSDIKTKFRSKHKEDGDHGDDVVKGQHIDYGTGSEQVDADLMPIGTAINNTAVGDNLNTTKVRAMLQKLADAVNLPIGTILMFDANRPSGGGTPGGASGAWQDDVTMLGWYACISGNSDHGCPNMVERFVMGKVVAGAGDTGGNNSMTITSAMLPTHVHTINHDHLAKTSSGPSTGSTGAQSASHTHSHTHGNIASGIQSANHTHTTDIGSHFHYEFNSNDGNNTLLGSNNPIIRGTVMNQEYEICGDNESPTLGRSSTVNIGNKASGNQSVSHTHTTNIPAKTSGTQSAGHTHSMQNHTHTINLDNFTGSSGNGGFANDAFDNKPAYYNVIYIRKCA